MRFSQCVPASVSPGVALEKFLRYQSSMVYILYQLLLLWIVISLLNPVWQLLYSNISRSSKLLGRMNIPHRIITTTCKRERQKDSRTALHTHQQTCMCDICEEYLSSEYSRQSPMSTSVICACFPFHPVLSLRMCTQEPTRQSRKKARIDCLFFEMSNQSGSCCINEWEWPNGTNKWTSYSLLCTRFTGITQ